MTTNQYVWTKEGYIGHNLLHSNYNSSNYKVTFIGAEKLDEDKWRVNFVYSYSSDSSSYNNNGYSANISLVVELMEKVRFESYLGITESVNVRFRPEEDLDCNRFFPVEFIKFIYIEKDYIKYEVNCI